MDFVSIDLAGRTYKLRYTAADIQDVCRRLNAYQPMGTGKVTPSGPHGLGTLIVNLDPDALQFGLWAGMRHIAEYKDADPSDAMRIISAHIERGGQWIDLRRPIIKTLIACGFSDFMPVLKVIDEAERQAAQDAAIEGQATSALEDDPGNGLTPSSTSLTRSSIASSERDGSDSSTYNPGFVTRDP
jgi:hypothetical protein